MKLLSLFDGTGSICKYFQEAGWQVNRLDISSKYGADIVCDIRNWDYTNQPVPDVIWAGCPCEQYSICRTNAKTPRNFELADSLIRETWAIIEYFLEKNPCLIWFIENPATSLLWKRPVSDPFPERIMIDYCSYGSLYRKRTLLATNSSFTPRPLCDPKNCASCVNGVHIKTAQRRPSKVKGVRRENDRVTLDQLHAYPNELCREIYKYCHANIWEVT